MRPQEIGQLQFQNIDFQHGSLSLIVIKSSNDVSICRDVQTRGPTRFHQTSQRKLKGRCPKQGQRKTQNGQQKTQAVIADNSIVLNDLNLLSADNSSTSTILSFLPQITKDFGGQQKQMTQDLSIFYVTSAHQNKNKQTNYLTPCNRMLQVVD